MHSHFTDCGLPGVSQIPFGVHMCSFYRTREELVAALVPFFLAGLRGNERCIWITAEPFPAVEAIAELQKSGMDARAQIERGALVVRDFSDWYAQAGSLKGKDVVDLWLAEEARTLADGYRGMRITGNVTFLGTSEEWSLFMEYEALVNQAFEGRRIVTLCTYWLDQCGAAEMMEVLQRHNAALERPDEGWQVSTGQRP